MVGAFADNVQHSQYLWCRAGLRHVQGVRLNRAADFRGEGAVLDPTMQQNVTLAGAPLRTSLGELTALLSP